MHDCLRFSLFDYSFEGGFSRYLSSFNIHHSFSSIQQLCSEVRESAEGTQFDYLAIMLHWIYTFLLLKMVIQGPCWQKLNLLVTSFH